jgi:hypothetical protein
MEIPTECVDACMEACGTCEFAKAAASIMICAALVGFGMLVGWLVTKDHDGR